MKTTLSSLVIQCENAEKLFERAARAWERANDGQKPPQERKRLLNQQDSFHHKAEAILTPFGITCDYPGLYPSFTVKGFGYHSVLSAVSAAVGEIEVMDHVAPTF